MSTGYSLLVNPAAGGGRAPEVARRMAALLSKARAGTPDRHADQCDVEIGNSIEIENSMGPQHVARQVGEIIARDRVVVAVGGDGFVSAVVDPVARAGGMMGIIPAGRGNDFARMLGLLTEGRHGQVSALLGQPRAVDLIEWDAPAGERRLVAGSVYAGLDAHTAALARVMRGVPVPIQYPAAALRAFAGYRPFQLRVMVDDEVSEHDAAMVTIANSAYYGRGMQIAPGALLDDGLLDVVVVAATTRRVLTRAFPSVYRGRHIDRPEVTVRRGRVVQLSADGPAGPMPVGADGEPLAALPCPPQAATARVRPGLLRVLA